MHLDIQYGSLLMTTGVLISLNTVFGSHGCCGCMFSFHGYFPACSCTSGELIAGLGEGEATSMQEVNSGLGLIKMT